MKPTTSALSSRSAETTVDQMKDLLRQLGDLSAYIDSVSDDGTVFLREISARPICVSLPDPTFLGESITDDRLNAALRSIEVLGQAISNFSEVRYGERRLACWTPDVKGRWALDPALTQRARDQPDTFATIQLPAGLLPRLGPEQVKLRIASLRPQLIDLSNYIDRIELSGGGDKVVFIFDQAIRGSATAAGLEDAIEHRDWFGEAEDAMRAMNEGFRGKGFVWNRST